MSQVARIEQRLIRRARMQLIDFLNSSFNSSSPKVIFLFEDENFTDNPESGNTDVGADDPAYYDNIYTQNLQETRDILKVFYEHVKAFVSDEEK